MCSSTPNQSRARRRCNWHAYYVVHWAISECHSHPLRFCVAFTHIQHQGSLSSVTSPSANQQPAIHKSDTSGEVDVIGQLCLDAHLPIRCQHIGICARSARHTNLRPSISVPLSILYLLIINLMEFLKVWAKHNFYYIRYISVYIQPRYFYPIFRSVNCNNMNQVILHSVRPSFWKKRDFPQAPRCGSAESGCEISVLWWLILADRGKMTIVWSRDRDTGDTSEIMLVARHACLR